MTYFKIPELNTKSFELNSKKNNYIIQINNQYKLNTFSDRSITDDVVEYTEQRFTELGLGCLQVLDSTGLLLYVVY